MYIYKYNLTERFYTVGYYDPDGTFWGESDHGDPDDAAARVAWLNGSGREKQCRTKEDRDRR